MPYHVCNIVPPYLLQALANSPDAKIREMCASTLAMSKTCLGDRHQQFLTTRAHRAQYYSGSGGGDGDDGSDGGSGIAPKSIIPNYLLDSIVQSGEADADTLESAKNTLETSRRFRQQRAAATGVTDKVVAAGAAAAQPVFSQEIYDMKHRTKDNSTLPGALIRKGGAAAAKDVAVNEVHDNTITVLQFLWEIFGYASVDGKNLKVVSSVHYDKNLANASWISTVNGEIRQMVYGDGDGKVFGRFTKALDVIGHEITHGITEFNSNLKYQDESGALNEHLSDVFGIMVKQRIENKKADEADWLIGEAVFMPDIKGVALRNMLKPGTAYKKIPGIFDGNDEQPDHYSKIEAVKKKFPILREKDSEEGDFGGVHYWSGIPNRAFALSATRLGGFAWEKAGRIWWTASTVHRDRIPHECRFIQFADVTVDTAQELFSADTAKIVRAAWNEVGVVRAH